MQNQTESEINPFATVLKSKPIQHAPIKRKAPISIGTAFGIPEATAKMYPFAIHPDDQGPNVPAVGPDGEYNFDGARDYLKDFLDMIEGKKGPNVLLIGPHGCGKTQFSIAIARALGLELFPVSCGEDFSMAEYYGSMVVVKGETMFIPGAMLRWAHFGGILQMDEINAAPPNAALFIHSVIDRVPFYVKETSWYVLPHPEAWVVGTMNPNYRGTHKFNQAFHDRFWDIEFDYMSPDKEVALLQKIYPTLGHELIKIVVKIANDTRQLFKGDGQGSMFSTALSMRGMKRILADVQTAQQKAAFIAQNDGQKRTSSQNAEVNLAAIRKGLQQNILTRLMLASPDGEQALAVVQMYQNHTGDTSWKPVMGSSDEPAD